MICGGIVSERRSVTLLIWCVYTVSHHSLLITLPHPRDPYLQSDLAYQSAHQNFLSKSTNIEPPRLLQELLDKTNRRVHKDFPTSWKASCASSATSSAPHLLCVLSTLLPSELGSRTPFALASFIRSLRWKTKQLHVRTVAS